MQRSLAQSGLTSVEDQSPTKRVLWRSVAELTGGEHVQFYWFEQIKHTHTLYNILCIYIYIHTYIYICICICIHICIFIFIGMRSSVFIGQVSWEPQIEVGIEVPSPVQNDN